MARALHKLTARSVEGARKRPGRHSDGGGLYLHVTSSNAVSGQRWIFRFTSPTTGKVREMGLGSAAAGSEVSLADARAQAAEARRLVKGGLDPIDERTKAEAAAAAARENAVTFADAADALIGSMESGWRNAKHRQQWRNTLATYAAPIAEMPVEDIGVDDVLTVLTPIWQEKAETASRVRGRIERVLAYAKTRGWRDGANPAVWRGNLDTVLPKRGRLTRGHHKALPYADMPVFMAELHEREALSARLMEFVILTACRTGEAIGARWEEVNMDQAMWTVPKERMKAKAVHRVPLSGAAMSILLPLREMGISRYVFPGQKEDKPLSTMTLLALIRRMGREGTITTHGFRSSFSDWCSEQTDFPAEVREMALAHTITNKAEAAYRRGDLLEKRRDLMEAWARWCTEPDR